jgi:hypothetical protein
MIPVEDPSTSIRGAIEGAAYRVDDGRLGRSQHPHRDGAATCEVSWRGPLTKGCIPVSN